MAFFRARARTLDLLGRQQIAGRPTAISELLKNAHDAYARNAVVDFYHSDRLFVLRDDGVGMSKEEFEQRWLVLGTESKARGPGQLTPPPVLKGMQRRPTLGEKGIGRLAIAAIGDQVLVISRPVSNGSQDLVTAFIPWLLFSCPGIDLHEIQIPLRAFSGGALPSAADVSALVEESRQNVLGLKSKLGPALSKTIIDGLNSFSVDPRKLDRQLGPPSLTNGGSGTHFLIYPADENLIVDIGDPEGFSPLKRMLVGFTNAMVPERTRKDFKVRFLDHRTDDEEPEELITGGFFKPEDFNRADHRLSGSFDKAGRFKGRLRIYKKEMSYELASPLNRPATACGPFSLEFAYVQGDIKDSMLYERDQEEYGRLSDLMRRFGGLYIYRDGVRILPYGNPDFDFLGIEERRSKGASYYFWSYRRIFGAVDLSSEGNPRLQEKAGREGFIEDEAYRQLKQLLQNLLVQLAAEHFREGSETAETFLEQRADINEREALRRRREVESRAKRSDFDRRLEEAMSRIERGDIGAEAERIVGSARATLAGLIEGRSPEESARAIGEVESEALERLESLRSSVAVPKPKGVGLSGRAVREYDAHGRRVATLERSVLKAAREAIESMADSAGKSLAVSVKRRQRADTALQRGASSARHAITDAKTALANARGRLDSRLETVVQDATSAVENEISRALELLTSDDLARLTGPDFNSRKRALGDSIRATAERSERLLERAKDAIDVVEKAVGGSADAPDEVMEALEEELIALQERERLDLELAQLGMAIEVINHEFAASIKGVRAALRRLKGWTGANRQLEPVYEELRGAFDHLDGYLTLFTPLQRRLYRSAAKITGANIAKYLEDLFADRMARHGVTLKASKAFASHSFEGYPSTFYPVFVNLIDNAIFWLSDYRGERSIMLDAHGQTMSVSDSGPGIPPRDRAALFRRGFTRKPAGRGLGLYISRAILARDGYDIALSADDKSGHATFLIRPREKE